METQTLDDNGTVSFGRSYRRPWIKGSGTWNSGVATIKINGISLTTTQNANFELQTEFESPVSVSITVAGATDPDLSFTVI